MGWIRGSDFALLPKCRLFYLFIYLMFYGSTFITNSLDRYGGIVIFFFKPETCYPFFFNAGLLFRKKKLFHFECIRGFYLSEK